MLPALVLILVAPAVLAHPYHTSLAEAEYNPETHCLEVALRLLPEDLEQVLSARAGEQVNLDATENVDALVLAYLADTFLLWADDASPPAPPRWVGKEVSHRAAWLYFELPLGEEERRWRLENRVLFDRVHFEAAPEQINTVLLRVDDRQTTLTFDAQRPSVELPPLGVSN